MLSVEVNGQKKKKKRKQTKKTVQNENKLCLLQSICQEPYII